MKHDPLGLASKSDSLRGLAISLAVVAALLLPLPLGLERPGIGVALREQHSRWIVTYVDSGELASRAGLRVGDAIIGLNGVRLTSRPRPDPLRLARARSWTVLRKGKSRMVHPSAFENSDAPLLLLVIGLAFWAVAAFIRLSKPADRLARRLFWLNIAMSGALALSAPAGNELARARVLEVASFAALPGLFLSSFSWLARGAPAAGRLALFTRVLFALGAGLGTIYLGIGLAGGRWLAGIADLLLVLLMAGFAAGLACLMRAYLQASSAGERQRLVIILGGTAAAILPVSLLSIVPTVAHRPLILPPEVAALTTVCFPVSIAYVVVRHHLLDIEVAVRRTLVYGVMTAFLAGCYALVLYGFDAAGFDQGALKTAAWLAFFALLTLTFTWVRDRIRYLIDLLIYRDRYDYAVTLRSLAEDLVSPRPSDEALSDVVRELAHAMNLCGAAVVVRDGEGGSVVRAASGDPGDPTTPLEAASVPDGLSVQRSAGWGGASHLPLVVHGEELGTLVLGPKRTGEELQPEDLSLAATVATHIASSVANALLIDRLRAQVGELRLLRDRLLSIQDEERKRIAQNLHDGALHAALELGRRTESLISCPEIGGVGVPRERLHILAEMVQDVAFLLRGACSELYPSELMHLGLQAALRELVRLVNRDENVAVSFSSGFPDDLRLPQEMEDGLYRVAREALRNVVTHAEAARASVELRIERATVILAIRDDGRGFTVRPSAVLLREGHLGLATLRERVEGLGGRVAIVSAPGKGTRVRVRVKVPDSGAAALEHEMRQEA